MMLVGLGFVKLPLRFGKMLVYMHLTYLHASLVSLGSCLALTTLRMRILNFHQYALVATF